MKPFLDYENRSLTKSQKTFTRGVPLGTWISKFWVFCFVSENQDTRQKCRQISSRMNAISYVLSWNLLNKTEQNGDFTLFPMQP
jgi:hypothetical protein